MKKKVVLGLAGVLMIAGLTGCAGKNPYLMDITYSKYVKLCDYKGVEASKVTFEVTDDEVQDAIDEDMYEYVTYETITDRAAQDGDYANITYTTVVDNVESEDYSGEEEDVVIGEGYIFPEVEEALVGMDAGENKKVDVEISEDYALEDGDVGKKATVDITLNEISKETYPEYNDDFVKENTDYMSTAEYEKAKKEALLKSKEEEYKWASVQEIMDYLLDNCEFNGYPEELYQQCEENYNTENEYSASMYGMELAEFEEMLGLDEETKKLDVESIVNTDLIIGAIAQAEKIACSEKEIKQYAKDNCEDYGYDSAEDMMEDYTEEEIGYQITYEKVANLLYENAKLTEISEDEYNEQQAALYEDVEDAEVVEEAIEDTENVDGIEEAEITEEDAEEVQK